MSRLRPLGVRAAIVERGRQNPAGLWYRGGNSDVNLLKGNPDTNVRVLAGGGDKLLGGEDFDLRLLHNCANQFNRKHVCNLSDEVLGVQMLRDVLSK